MLLPPSKKCAGVWQTFNQKLSLSQPPDCNPCSRLLGVHFDFIKGLPYSKLSLQRSTLQRYPSVHAPIIRLLLPSSYF